MKSYRKELWFDVPTRRELINITPQIEACHRDIMAGKTPKARRITLLN